MGTKEWWALCGALGGTSFGCLAAVTVQWGNWYEIGDALLTLGFFGFILGALTGIVIGSRR